MNILLLEPYYGGSHKYFIDQLSSHLESEGHNVTLISLAPRHWRSRLQLGHLSLIQKLKESMKEVEPRFDLILLNSLMDCATFKSLLPPSFSHTPLWIYFHENQMGYPLDKDSPTFKRDEDIQKHIIPSFHLNQVLCGDKLIFNSNFTRENTFNCLSDFINSRSENTSFLNLDRLKENSLVIPVGTSPSPLKQQTAWVSRPKRILWNHRWEYDKGPQEFFSLFEVLIREDPTLSLSLLGENNRDKSGIFSLFKSRYHNNIHHFGFIESKDQYWKELDLCRVLPVTSIHDFLGLSLLEAIEAGVIPLLPDRLVYPELIPSELHSKLIYQEFEELKDKTLSLLNSGLSPKEWEHLKDHLLFTSQEQVNKLWSLNISNL